jgi:hypothetical protein
MTVYTDNEQQAIVTKLELKRLRAELVRDEEGNEDFFAFQARCIRKFGLAAGVFVRQLVFWTGKGMDPDGWIYKTRDELLEEIGLSQRQQDKARKTLTGLGVLEEDRRTVAPHHFYCAMHYRVNLEKLVEVLETPHSTLNQWKRGRRYAKDLETGRFDRLPEKECTTSQDVSLGNSESEVSLAITESEVRHTISESEVSLGNSDSGVRLGNSESDVRLGNSDSTTESTSGEYFRESTEGTSEEPPGEFPFQGVAGAQNRAAPPQPMNKNFSQGQEQDEAQPNPTTSSPPQPSGVPKLVDEVARVLVEGKHSPTAVKHYRAGRVDAEVVAEHVSQDLIGNMTGTEKLLPLVRRVLDAMKSEVAS